MVAPTAKLKTTNKSDVTPTVSVISNKTKSSTDKEEDSILIDASSVPNNNDKNEDEDDEMITEENEDLLNTTSKNIDPSSINNTSSSSTLTLDQDGRPKFSSVENSGEGVKFDQRNIRVPFHRFGPLKHTWLKIYEPLVNHLNLQVRMNARKKEVQIRSCKKTTDPGAVQKGEDFLNAFMIGFDIDDAVALLRLNDLYTETFEVKDVKTLTGDHLSRAIGRIAGKDGKTKYAIENATRTRIVLADSKIHILGGFENVKIARETIVSLILGAPPGKVYGNLRVISSRLRERY